MNSFPSWKRYFKRVFGFKWKKCFIVASIKILIFFFNLINQFCKGLCWSLTRKFPSSLLSISSSGKLQAYLILLRFTVSCFAVTAVFIAWRFVATLCQASLWPPFIQQHLLTSHLGNSRDVPNFFLLWWFVISDRWCSYCKKTVESSDDDYHFLATKYFSVKIYTFWASLLTQLVKNAPAMQETLVWFLGGWSPGVVIGYPLQYSWVSLVAQMIKGIRLQCGSPGFSPWVG